MFLSRPMDRGMYRVTCKQCGASDVTLNGSRLQDAVQCGCCPENHDHQAAADACPGAGSEHLGVQHPGADCTHLTEGGIGCLVLTPVGEECPGGHCYPGVEGCTVCRPLLVEFLGGLALGPAAEQLGGVA